MDLVPKALLRDGHGGYSFRNLGLNLNQKLFVK